MLESNRNIDGALDSLQELQLLSYTKNAFLLNRSKEIPEFQKKKDEKKLATEVAPKKPKQVEPKNGDLIPLKANASTDVDNVGQKLFGLYCMLWKQKYHAYPPKRSQDLRQLKDLGKTNGFEKTAIMVDAYFKTPDSFFVKRRHDLQTFFNNLHSISAFIETGTVVSQSETRQLDQMVSYQNTLNAIRNGEV